MRLQAPNTREVEMCYVADVYMEPHFTKSELHESADVAKAEFKLWLDQIKADAWDDCLELLESNSEIDMDDLDHYKEICPYRKQGEA